MGAGLRRMLVGGAYKDRAEEALPHLALLSIGRASCPCQPRALEMLLFTIGPSPDSQL